MSSFRTSLVLTFAQQYGCAAISFVSVVILARLLSPAEVGVYSVSAAVVGIAHMLRDFGVGRYLIQEPDLTRDRLRTAFGIGIGTAWVIAGALFLGRGYIAEFYHEERLRQVITVLSVNFLIIPFGAPILWMLMREMKFRELLVINIVSQAVQATSAIILAAYGFSYMSMAWASLAGNVATTTAATLLDPRYAFILPSFKSWRRILGFGTWASGQSLVGELGMSAGDLILGRTLGFGAVALYSRANGLVATVHRDLLKAIIIVAFPALAERHRQRTDLTAPYVKGTGYLTVLVWPVLAFLGIMAYPLISFLFGERWIAAAPLLQILCLSTLFSPVVALAGQLMLATGRVQEIFRIEVAQQSLRVAMILLGSLFGLVAVALLQIVPAVFSSVLWLRSAERAVGVPASALARPCLLAFVVTLFSSLGPFAVQMLAGQTSLFVLLAVAGTLWGVGWLVGVFAMRHPIREEVERIGHVVFGAVAMARLKRR